jgi:membrane associated rhomboid family serine protease
MPLLNFKSKKKVHFPKLSLMIWLLTFATIILTTYYNNSYDLYQKFAINPSQFILNLKHSFTQIFLLISAIFLHGSWQHWAGNMILFLIIAFPLERKVGSFWFLLFFLLSGFSANVSSIYQLSHSEHYLLGASGAVSGLLGAWLMLFPRLKINIIIPIGLYMQKAQIPVLLLAFTWLSIQIILQLISPNNYSIVWSSHIVGFIIGFLMAWLYRVTAK